MPTLNINNDVVLFPSANVGIGSTPTYKLDVATPNDNAIRIFNSLGSNNNGLALAVGSGTPWLDFAGTYFSIKYNTSPGSWNSGANIILTLTATENVLIGTTTDSGYKLAVNGSAGLALSSGGIVVASYDGNTGNIKPSVANGSVLISDDSGTVGRGTEFLNNGGFIASTTQSLVSSFNSSIQDTLVYTRVTATQQTTTSGTSPAAIELVGLRGDSTHGRHAWIGAEGVDSTTFRTKLLFKIRGESNTGYQWSGAAEAPTILAVDGNGLVGVNNSSPANQLQIGSMGSTGYSGNHLTIGDGTSVFAVYMASNLTNLYTNKAFSFQASGSGATGNVLINTTTDAGIKLDVNGTGRFSGGLLYLGNYSGNPELTLQATNNSWSKINFYDNNSTEGLYIRTDGASYGGTMTFGARWDDDEGKVFFKMFQSSAGAAYDVKIGVNTGSPESMFHLDKSSSANDISNTPSIIISNKDSTSGTFVGGGIFNNPYRDVSTSSVTAGVWFENQNSPDAGAAAKSSAVVFGANSYSTGWALPTERMRITQGGLVGIGTSNPLSKFDVSLESGQALFIANEAGTISDGDLLGAVSFGSRDGSTYSSGGITNIRSYATATYNTGSVSGDMRFYVSSSLQNTTQAALFGQEAMRINSNGNILIGTTTDSGYKLRVNGSSYVDSNLTVAGTLYGNTISSSRYIRYNFNGQNFAVGASTGTRWVIGRIYWNQYHWGAYSGMDVEIVNNQYNGGRKLYSIANGAGGGSIYLRQSQNYGSQYVLLSLGSAVDTGTTYAGEINYYQDVYLDVSEYNQVSVNLELKGPLISIDKTSISGGEYGYATAFSSPSASTISTFTNQAATILSSEGNWGYIDNRLGINVANPDYQLDVYSANTPVVRISSQNSSGVGNPMLILARGGEETFKLAVDPNVGAIFRTVVANVGYMDFYTGTDSLTLRMSGNKNVLIGTTTDAGYKLDVNGTGRFGVVRSNYYDIPSGTGFNSFQMGADTSAGGWYVYNLTTGTYNFVISNSGNVLIGTTTDSGYKLDVNGTGYFRNVLRAAAANTFPIRAIATSGGVSRISFEDDVNQANDAVWVGSEGYNLCFGSNFSEQARISSSGNLIIGSTTDAGYKLDVYGEILGRENIRITNTYALILNGSDNNWRIGRNTITDSGWLTSNTLQIVVFGSSSGQGFQVVNSNGTALFEIDGVAGASRFTNALGVGVNPSGTAGRIDASNDIVAYSSSDLRLKENIKPIENALDKVKALTGVEFDWKAEHKEAHGYEGHDTGVIAQEVQEVMPTAVRTNDTGYLAVRYEKLIGLLIEAVKEQQTEIDELKKLIK